MSLLDQIDTDRRLNRLGALILVTWGWLLILTVAFVVAALT